MAECPGLYVLAAMRDGLLARLRVPGGEIGAAALRRLAEAALTFGDGALELTNRANLQVRALSPAGAEALQGAATDAGLAPHMLEADRLRNIAANPLRGFDPQDILDTGPLVAELDRALQVRAELWALSPKFSFALDGGSGRVLAIGHDAGLRAERHGSDILWRLSLAGELQDCGTGHARGVDLLCAAATAALAAPERRMRGLVAHQGARAALASVARIFDGPLHPLPPAAPAAPAPPLPGALFPSRSGGGALVLGLVSQRLDAGAAIALAGLVDRFGSGALRLTPWQALVLPDLDTEAAADAAAAAHELGAVVEPTAGRLRVIACSGTRGCTRGRADTRAAARALRAALAEDLTRESPLTVHVSGCTRGCAHPQPAEALLLARIDGRGYDLHARAVAREAEARTPEATALSPIEAARPIAALARQPPRTRQP